MTVASAKIKSSVPGQYLGYALQPVRFCSYLLRVQSGDKVSLEHLDDVTVHKSDGQHILEQCKSGLSNNPISNKSTDLWKSIANWADLCKMGVVNPKLSTFILYVTPEHHGDIVWKIHTAKSCEDAQAILDEIQKWVTKKNAATGCNPLIAQILSYDKSLITDIICRFRLIIEPDPVEPIRQLLRATLPESAVNDFCSAAIGLAKEMVDELIRNGNVPIVDAHVFRTRFQAFVRKHSLAGLLTGSSRPENEDVAKTIASSPIFVQQLNHIKAHADVITTAVSDFLRTQSDKVKWAADGIIVEESLEELDSDLTDHFIIVKDEIEDIYVSSDPETRGRHLYRRCIRLQFPLEGRTLPNHFIGGSYNALADGLRLGWHPNYMSLCGKDDD